MRIWAPYTSAKSGSTIFTHNLAAGLTTRGFQVTVQEFPHQFQYFPKALRFASPPPETDVILTNTWNGPGFHRTGIPSLFVEHLFVLDPLLDQYKSTGQKIFHELLVKRFVQESYRAGSRIVSVSEYTKNAALKVFPSTDIRVILNGIDETFFTPAERTPSPRKSPFKLLFVGNLTRRKGADLLPPLMAALGNDFVLRYTGHADAAPGNFGASNLVALGRLSRDEMREEYRGCDAMIAPSRMEGLSLAMLEAASCGLPIIASNRASMPEIVLHEQNGLICEADDIAGFAEAARFLRDNPDELRTMRLEARVIVERKFSFSRMVDQYADLLRSVA